MSRVLFLFATLIAAAPAAAQDSTGRVRLVGLTLDHWRGASGPALLRPTVRFTRYGSRGPGVELAVVTFPDGISLVPPGVVFGLQAGLVQPLRAGPVTFLAKAGVASITLAGLLPDSRLVHLIPGAQAGLGVLLPLDRKSTIRLDLTRHVYRSSGYPHRVWSVGFGFAGGLIRR